MTAQTYAHSKQNRLISKTWRTSQDIKFATAFAKDAEKYKVLPLEMPEEISVPIVIFSREMVVRV